uniref:Reverse transcriptase domain-containing protein n=1 Tax=Mesocestoides corti TaxID=53468 RepID=A0A5K3F693_MESCO
ITPIIQYYIVLLTPVVNRVYSLPYSQTQGSPFLSVSIASRILNSPLIRLDIYLRLLSQLGLDVSACMTHTSKV